MVRPDFRLCHERCISDLPRPRTGPQGKDESEHRQRKICLGHWRPCGGRGWRNPGMVHCSLGTWDFYFLTTERNVTENTSLGLTYCSSGVEPLLRQQFMIVNYRFRSILTTVVQTLSLDPFLCETLIYTSPKISGQ